MDNSELQFCLALVSLFCIFWVGMTLYAAHHWKKTLGLCLELIECIKQGEADLEAEKKKASALEHARLTKDYESAKRGEQVEKLEATVAKLRSSLQQIIYIWTNSDSDVEATSEMYHVAKAALRETTGETQATEGLRQHHEAADDA